MYRLTKYFLKYDQITLKQITYYLNTITPYLVSTSQEALY